MAFRIKKNITILLKHRTVSLLLILTATFLLHFFVAFYYEGTGDTGGWRLIGKTGLHGGQLGVGNGTVYDGDCPLLCGNWTPFTYHTYIFTQWAYENLNPLRLPDIGYYKLFPIINTVIITYVLYKSALILKKKNPLFFAFLFAFHPLSLYISAYHGQREVSWLLFLVISALLLKLGKFFWFFIAYALAISIKIPPILLSPFFLLKLPTKKDKILFLFVVPTLFFILNLPEIATHTNNVIKQVFFYSGLSGWWGLSGIAAKIDIISGEFMLTEMLKPVNRIVLYTGILSLSMYFYKKNVEILESILGIILVIFVLSPIFASQYLLWPLPFMILMYKKYKKYFWFYSGFGLYAAVNTYGIFGIRFLEYAFVNIPQTILYYKIPFLSYPQDMYFPVWIVSSLFLRKILYESRAK